MNSLFEEIRKIQQPIPLAGGTCQMESFLEASRWFDKLVEAGIAKKRKSLVEYPMNAEHSNFAPALYQNQRNMI